MRALPLLVLAMALFAAGCVNPQIDEPPDAPQEDDGSDGLVIVAPGGGGESRCDRLARLIED